MARDGYHIETQAIEETVVQMAVFVEELIARAMNAMSHADEGLADELIVTDRVADDLRSKVRRSVIQVIERWAPMGPALRRAVWLRRDRALAHEGHRRDGRIQHGLHAGDQRSGRTFFV